MSLRYAVLALAFLTLLFGGATRVWEAGMSCPDWPQCYGLWWPFHMEQFVVGGTSYSVFQVFLEWFHRLLASITGIALVATVVQGFRKKDPRVWWLVAAGAVLAVQIALGGLTVFQNNIHWSVALHLGGALYFLALVLVACQNWAYRPKLGDTRTIWPLKLFGLVLLAQLLLGAFVSTSYSGGVCGELWLCHGQFFVGGWQEQLHMGHRLGAIFVVILSIAVLPWAKRCAPATKPLLVLLHLMVWGQLILGILTLYSFQSHVDVYRALSLGHLVWGSLMWLLLVQACLSALKPAHNSKQLA